MLTPNFFISTDTVYLYGVNPFSKLSLHPTLRRLRKYQEIVSKKKLLCSKVRTIPFLLRLFDYLELSTASTTKVFIGEYLAGLKCFKKLNLSSFVLKLPRSLKLSAKYSQSLFPVALKHSGRIYHSRINAKLNYL